MRNRYRTDIKALDLKSFHTDNAFIGESVYAPLARSNVLYEVIQIVGKEIPDVEAIDFSRNRIPTLNHFSTLAELATNISILYLSDNRLSDISELKKLKYLKNLKELNLNGNVAMEKRCGSQQEFVKAVQKILPCIQSLNGDSNLPKVILFEGDEDSPLPDVLLPSSQQKMLGSSVDPKIDHLVAQFLEKYFEIFDDSNRLPLEAAYHQEALFSISVSQETGSANKTATRLLSDYQGDIRNLLLVKNKAKRCKLLRQGRSSVIDYLANYFPKTKHSLNSFTLDVPFAASSQSFQAGQGFIGPITITGVLKQCTSRTKTSSSLEQEEDLFRHFNHTIILVPQGQGFVIVNEMMVINLPTSHQIKVSIRIYICYC